MVVTDAVRVSTGPADSQSCPQGPAQVFTVADHLGVTVSGGPVVFSSPVELGGEEFAG